MRWREKISTLFLTVMVALLGGSQLLWVSPVFAQTVPPPSSGSITEVCGLGVGSRPYTISILAQPPVSENGPVSIPTTAQVTVAFGQNAQISGIAGNLYRVISGQGTFTKISSVAFTRQTGSTTNWTATFRDTTTGTLSDYRYIVRADVSYTTSGLGGTGVHCSSQFRVRSPNESPEYTEGTIKGWFNNQNIEGLTITVSNQKGSPPSLVVSRGKLGNRPPDDLTFKLVAHSGEGAVVIGNTDWLTFQGYIGDTKLNNLYFVTSDDLDANFYYSTNFNELKKGHLDSSGTEEIGRAVAREGDAYERSLATVFTYIMNLPLNSDGSVGGDNCGSGVISGDKRIAITGPKGQGLTPEPDNETTLEAGVNGEDARELNQNCLNKDSNGWLKYWGVTDVFSSDPGTGECGLSTILAAGGLGDIFNTLTLCIIETVFIPIVTWVAGIITEAAGISWVPMQKIRLSFAGTALSC